MKVRLRQITPDISGNSTFAFLGLFILVWCAAAADYLGFVAQSWMVWLLILIVPAANLFSYLGFKYFHLTRRIKSERLRKGITDTFKFWVEMSARFNLIYAEYSCDKEGLAYVGGFFAENFPLFRIRIYKELDKEEATLRIFSNRQVARDIGGEDSEGIILGNNVVGGIEMHEQIMREVYERVLKTMKEKQEKNQNDPGLN